MGHSALLQLEQFLAHGLALPCVPRVVALLLIELRRREPSLRRIDQLVCLDPVLALRLMQAANAPELGLAGRIHSVSEALALLPLAQVQAALVQASASAAMRTSGALLLTHFWSYSVDSAKVARSLAALLQLDQQSAFSCGLMHAIGELLMRQARPDVLPLDDEVSALELRRSRVERQRLGYCFTQVSAALARQYQLPAAIVLALEHQHAPFDDDSYEPLAGVLHLAVWRARARHAGLHGNALTVTFPAPVAELLGLDIDMVLQQDPIDWSAAQTANKL